MSFLGIVIKDLLNEKGDIEIYGSKDAIRAAFASDLIQDGEVCMDMIQPGLCIRVRIES